MKQYLLFPHNDGDLQDKIFESPFGWLCSSLQKKGIELHTYDRGDLAKADKVLCFNHRPAAYAACQRAGLRRDQLVLFLMEPKPVVPDQYRPEVWNQYGTVFTFLDNLVDHKHIFKMYYPQGQELMEQLPGWSERKFLTLMNANKYSYVQHELYSVRRQAIRYFERNPDFDLYGFDWNHNGTLNLGAASQAFKSGHWIQYVMDVIAGFRHAACYRGTVPDKRATIAKYKFAIAFENESKTQGYITEKIFDCFFAGTVPVYLGAENITYYVPADCFVDFRKFSGFAELEKFLRAMTEPEFLRYQKNGQRFLHGPAFAPWLPKNVFASITEHL